MSDHGIFPRQLRAVHHKHMTPHGAIAPSGTALLVFNDAGTRLRLGFLLAYFMVSVAAPVYLRKLGELLARHIAVATLAFLCLMVPTVGSFYPAPPYPVNLFPYIFLGYMIVGGAWMYAVQRSRPATMAEIEAELEGSITAHREAGTPREHQALGPFEVRPRAVEA